MVDFVLLARKKNNFRNNVYKINIKLCDTADFNLLNFEQAQTLVLGNDLSGLVAVLVNRKSVGIKPKLFGYLKWEERYQNVNPADIYIR